MTSHNPFYISTRQTLSTDDANIGSDLGLAVGWQSVPTRDKADQILAWGIEAGVATANNSLFSGDYRSAWAAAGLFLDTDLDNLEKFNSLYLRFGVLGRFERTRFSEDLYPRGAFASSSLGLVPHFEVGSDFNHDDEAQTRSALFFYTQIPFNRVLSGYMPSMIALVPEMGVGISF